MSEDLKHGKPQKDTLADFFARSPLRECGVEIERFKEIAQPPDLGDEPAPPLNPCCKSQK